MIFPQVIFIIQAGPDYAGINILATDSEANFLARFQEIAEGDFDFLNVFWTFNQDKPYIQPPLAETLMYKFGRIFFSKVSQIFLLAKFILPALLFLVIYFFVLLFNSDKKIALVSSVGVMFYYSLGSVSEFKSFLAKNFIIPEPSIFSRPIVPVFGLILLFSFLSFLYLYITQSKKRYLWPAGICFGLSFYIYFFTWTFLVVFIFVSALWFLIKRDWLNLKKIFWIIFLSALIALPYWFNLYKLLNNPIFDSSASQTGFIISNSPIIGKYLIIVLILYFLNLYTKRIRGENLWFWSILIISFFTVLNQQIITGRILQPAHYHWYIIKPTVIILLVWFVFGLIQDKHPKYFWLSTSVFAVIGFYLITGQQIFVFLKNEGEVNAYAKQYGSVFNWLNQNMEKEQSIFTGISYTGQRGYVNLYTHLDEYLIKNRYHWIHYEAISGENRLYVLFLEYRLNKITPEMAEKLFFRDLRDEIFFRLLGYEYRLSYTDKDQEASDDMVRKILNEYTEFYQISLESAFKKYPVDYILWDGQLNPEWSLDEYNFLERIYEVKNIKIYKFI